MKGQVRSRLLMIHDLFLTRFFSYSVLANMLMSHTFKFNQPKWSMADKCLAIELSFSK